MLEWTDYVDWDGIPEVKGSGGKPNFGTGQTREGQYRTLIEPPGSGELEPRIVAVVGTVTMRFPDPVNRGTGFYRFPIPFPADDHIDPWQQIGTITVGFVDLKHRTGNIHLNGSSSPYGPFTDEALAVIHEVLFLDQNLKAGVDIENFHYAFDYRVDS